MARQFILVGLDGPIYFDETRSGTTPLGGLWHQEAVATGIAFDRAGNSGAIASASSFSGPASWSDADRMLAVDVTLLGPGVTVTSMTYGGATCTFVGAISTVTSFGRVEQRRIVSSATGAPPTGSNTLVVNLSGSIEFSVEWASYSGVHQTSPTEAFNSAQATNTGAATDASVNVTSIADNCWIRAACAANDTSITAGNTSRNNVPGTLGSGANEDNGGPKTPAGSVAMSYTGMGITTTWAIAGYAIRPLAASGAAHAATGAPVADAATVAGTATHLTLHTSTGAVAAGAATVVGAAAHEHAAAGAVVADAATVAGVAAHLTLHTSSGELTASAATVSGAGAHEHVAAGTVAAGEATVAGAASRLALHDASGAVAAGGAVVEGVAAKTSPSHASSGDVSAGAATVAGAATHLTLHAATGAVAAGAATVSGAALRAGGHVASGNLSASAATVVGAATRFALHAATGAAAAGSATVTGAAFIGLGPAIYARIPGDAMPANRRSRPDQLSTRRRRN